MMKEELIGFFSRGLMVAIFLTGLSTSVNAGQEESASYPASPAVVTTATPAQDNKGTGMGQVDQRQTPGPGAGPPGFRGGYSSDPGSVAESPNPPINSPYYRYAVPPDQRYGKRGYGRGRYGYGVGYPGYRGQGGTGYPQHRQYGTPPRYPAAGSPGEQAVPQQQGRGN